MRTGRRLLMLALFCPALLFACGGDDNQGAEDAARDAAEAAEDAAQEAGESLQEAWATMQTEGERLIDEIQARNDPEAKDQLLDTCRDRLEDLRQAESPAAEPVESLCDRIRDTDVSDRDAWEEIKNELERIDVGQG